MARLTKEQWIAARAWWEGDAGVSFGQVAAKYGCSRPAVGQTAEREGWAKGGTGIPASVPAASPADPKGTKVTPKVSAPAKAPESKPKVSGKGKAKAPSQPKQDTPASNLPALSQHDRELMIGRRPRGRPTDYRPEFVDEMISYFNIEVQSIIDVDYKDKDGKTQIEKKVVTNTFPTLTRFAAKLNVTRDTLYEWSTAKDKAGALKYPEFSYAYARAKDFQESLLVEGGMAGIYEPRFAVFAAKNLAGWKDQIETTGEVTHTITTTAELDDFYASGTAKVQASRAAVLARRERAANAIDVDVRE
jgi:hypothetical protein